VVDIVATNVAVMPLFVGVMVAQSSAAKPALTDQAIAAAMQSSPLLFSAALVLGCLCSILGGWAAARLAQRAESLHGALSSFLCVGLGIYAWIKGSPSIGTFQHLVFLVLSPALGAIGGMLQARQRERRQAAGEIVAGVASLLSGWSRALYFADRILQWTAGAFLGLFVTVGLYGRGAGNYNIVIGAIAFAFLGALLAGLYLSAARALVAGRRHWPIRALALLLTLLPIVAFGSGA
jgi:hypothetical protein